MERAWHRIGTSVLASALLWSVLGLGCSSGDDESVENPGVSAAGMSSMPLGGASAGTPAGPPVTSAGGAGASSGSSGGGGQSAGSSASPPAGAGDAGTSDSGSDPATDAGNMPGATVRSTGPGDWVAGDYPPALMEESYLEITGVKGQGERVRQYKVHVPKGYDPNVPAPAVFCIHGLGQTAVLFCLTGAEMPAKSDAGGFILIMPNGYMNSWNAGTCCGAASSERLDDVALFRAIFAEVGKHVNIDLDRVYATGLSNGGYMSFRLACDAADMLTAVAPSAAAIGINSIGGGTNNDSDFTACTPSQPVSVLEIHGTADPLIPYSLQKPSFELMAKNDGCMASTKPAAAPRSAGDTRCVSHEGCPSGIELTACTIEDGGHCWFGSEDCGTGGGAIGLAIVGNNSDTMLNTDAVWDFFKPLSR